jgi:hypothetical protein
LTTSPDTFRRDFIMDYKFEEAGKCFSELDQLELQYPRDFQTAITRIQGISDHGGREKNVRTAHDGTVQASL